MSASTHVYVLDAGTFALGGYVHDGGTPISGARIEVIGGAGSGLHTTTDARGAYSLVGVGGSATLAATFDGYQPATTVLNVSKNDTTVDFSLNPVGNRLDVSGAWLLAVATSPSCTGLPPDAMHRTYPLSISQLGTLLTITFTVPAPAQPPYGSVIVGGVLLASTLTFTLPNDPVDGPWIFQTLDSGETFLLSGSATAALSGEAFQGHLDGTVQVFTTWPGVSCSRNDHAISLARTGS